MSSNPARKDLGFRIGLGAVVLIGGILRTHDLGAIQDAVFDEVHFARYGYDYLVGTQFLHVHPPLYNYLSAISIWLYYHLPWLDLPAVSALRFEQIDVLSYRWINALAGTGLVLLVGMLAYQLTGRRVVALLGAFFVAVDGSLVVDSRVALNNIFLPVFGFLAFWCVGRSLQNPERSSSWLLAAGVSFGCGISIKWNGLGYMLALFVLLAGLKLIQVTERLRPARLGNAPTPASLHLAVGPLMTWLCLLVVPLVIYCLLWIPDRTFNNQDGFFGIHGQIFDYHSSAASVGEHPYCSKWYLWPLMERPISYYFKVREAVANDGQTVRFFSGVHLFGNPVLYWLSLGSVLAMAGQWVCQAVGWFRTGKYSPSWLMTSVILLGYGANLMPWALVNRCLFLYHYQSASVFAFLALAWYCGLAWVDRRWWLKLPGILAVGAVFAALIYWLPLILGIELPAGQYYRLMWFNRWI
ncbi:MAG: dolichyl-phosphate-mannose-protein mannosyltransferase [Verrucomicrobiota bacterium]|nr:dolichyl-phosphate-mannose-protein mannosyltransferase [Verrucomicrobiota bacterium]